VRVATGGFGLIGGVGALSVGFVGSVNNLCNWVKEVINLSNNSSVVLFAFELDFLDFAVFKYLKIYLKNFVRYSFNVLIKLFFIK